MLEIVRSWRRVPTQKFSLAQSLGYAPDDRLLIVNCDDFGSSRSANLAIERSLREGAATSATLMVPCPWARLAAKSSSDLDIGVHLTLTSEYPAYRWPSLTGAASLHDKDGYLPMTTQEVWARADLADVERECVAQIDCALDWGIDVTHIDSHMDILQLDRNYFAVYMRLARRYGLPVRLCRSSFEWPFSAMSQSKLDEAGIVTTDGFIAPPWGEEARGTLFRRVPRIASGVTEFVVHPAADSEELRAYDTEYADLRVADALCLTDPALKSMIAACGIRTIGYRPLRDAMRGRA